MPIDTTLLRATRERMGLSLSDVAEQTGIDKSTLSRIENGKRSINLDGLPKIAAAYRLTYEEIIGPPTLKK